MRSPARMHRLLVGCVLLALCAGCATTADGDMRKRQARSHLDLGLDHLQKGRVELGLRELLTAERFDPRDARIQERLGMTYYQKGRAPEAERHLRRALELSPDYHDARYNLAVLLLSEERFAECIAESQRLFDDPTFVAPWTALTTRGWCEYKSGRVAEARRLLELSHDYDSGYWPTLLNLGTLEADEGNRGRAVALLEQVLALRPGPSAEAEANYRLGELYVALGERDRAVNHLAAAVQRSPNGPWGKKSEESLKRLR